jgi:hypothetical protein
LQRRTISSGSQSKSGDRDSPKYIPDRHSDIAGHALKRERSLDAMAIVVDDGNLDVAAGVGNDIGERGVKEQLLRLVLETSQHPRRQATPGSAGALPRRTSSELSSTPITREKGSVAARICDAAKSSAAANPYTTPRECGALSLVLPGLSTDIWSCLCPIRFCQAMSPECHDTAHSLLQSKSHVVRAQLR